MLLFFKVPISIHRDISDFIVIFFFFFGPSCLLSKKTKKHSSSKKDNCSLRVIVRDTGIYHIIVRQGLQKIST